MTMYAGTEEARRYALGLLRGGLSPEQAEEALSLRLTRPEPRTALSDPTNVLMKEVVPMGQPTRGPVDIMGVTTRTNTSENRYCASEACPVPRIETGKRYERVARKPGPTIESYHTQCFEEEFGARELYGD